MSYQGFEIQINGETSDNISVTNHANGELQKDKLTLNKEGSSSLEFNPVLLSREYYFAQQEFNYRNKENQQLHTELNELKTRLKQAEERIEQQEEQIMQLSQKKQKLSKVAINLEDDDYSQMFITAQHHDQKQKQHNQNRYLSNNQEQYGNKIKNQEYYQESQNRLHKFQQSDDQNAISFFNKPHIQMKLTVENSNENCVNDLKKVSSQPRETSDVIHTYRQMQKGNLKEVYEENEIVAERENSQNCLAKFKKSSQGKDQVKFDITNQIVALGYEQLKEGTCFKPKPQKAMLKEKKQRLIQNKSSFDAIFIKKNQKIIQFKNNLEQKLFNQKQYRNSVQPRLNKPSNLLLDQKYLIQYQNQNQLEDFHNNQSDLIEVSSQKNNQNQKGNQKSQQNRNFTQNDKVENIQIPKLNDNSSNLYTYQINSTEKINIQIFQQPDDNQGQDLPYEEFKFDQSILNQQEKSNIFRNSLQILPENSDYYQNQKDFLDQSQSQVHLIYSKQPSQNTINSFKMFNASSENNQKNESVNQNNINYSYKKSNINQNCQEIQNNPYLQNQNDSAQSSQFINNIKNNSIRFSEKIQSDNISSQNDNNNKNSNLLNYIILNQTIEQIPSSSEEFDNFGISLEDSNMKTIIVQDPEQIKYEEERLQYKELFNNLQQLGELGDLLFEEFMVIGPDLEELKDLIQENPNPFSSKKECCQAYVKGNLQQSILFSQPCYISPFQDILRQEIAKKAFPNGLQYYRFKSQSDLQNMPRRFKDILLMDLCKQKQCGVDKNIFILTIRDEENKRNRHISLENTNSNSLIYGICYQQDDMLVVQDELTNEKTIFLFPTVYCFMTYYPFIDYFLQITLEIVNRIKTIRLIKGSFSGKIDNNLQDIDFEKVIKYLQRDRDLSLSLSALQIKDVWPDKVLTYFLKNAQSYILQKEDQTQSNKMNRITLNSQAEEQCNQFSTISFKVPSLEEMCYVEGLETAYLTFSNLPYSDFQLIFTLIMLEKKIVFLSKNITLLTFTSITFQNIIKPFKFPYSIISSLTKDKIDFIDCPVQFMFGVNQSSEEFKYQYGYNDECYYIDLDKNIINSFNPIDIYTIYNQRFKFTSQKEQIKQLFKEINNNIASRQLGNKFQKLFQTSQNNKELVYNPNKQQMQNLKSLLALIRKSIYECIVNKLPTTPIFLENDDFGKLTVEISKAVLKNNLQDKYFLDCFVETQTFSYYIQQIYL
ncbi:hypothetical protein ABPG72_014039 [Tetrahymena utriculariae]